MRLEPSLWELWSWNNPSALSHIAAWWLGFVSRHQPVIGWGPPSGQVVIVGKAIPCGRQGFLRRDIICHGHLALCKSKPNSLPLLHSSCEPTSLSPIFVSGSSLLVAGLPGPETVSSSHRQFQIVSTSCKFYLNNIFCIIPFSPFPLLLLWSNLHLSFPLLPGGPLFLVRVAYNLFLCCGQSLNFFNCLLTAPGSSPSSLGCHPILVLS